MIVDCHVNIFNPEQTLPLFHSLTPSSRPGSMGMAADADTIYKAMADVDKAIIFSLRYKDAIGVDGDDEVTAAAVAKYPDKFIGFAAMDPRRPDYMDLLVHAIEDLGLKGVKFGPIYNGVSLLDPRLEPVYEYLQRKNLPLTMHMGTTFGANAPVQYGRPLDVDTIAARYPDLKMVMAHMGHPWYEECIIVARKQPNVYCEVSALYYRPWQFYNILVCAQEYLITERNKIFWGTDFPWTTVEESIQGLRSINDQIEGTNLPRISQSTIERILHSNPLEHWWHGGYAG
ncbi:amidohydrolase family protein [Brucella pituitosa]|uniref:amidohydrolase family protein n=1 Tax=Brucella pituitosa TaxID=571256 RepID=UPI003F4AECFA